METHPVPTPAEAEIAERIGSAARERTPLSIQGNATKAGMLRPVQAARTISTAGYSGISLYAPKELIISAHAGTPLPEIEAALAEQGQHLIAEPADLSAILGASDKPQTIGGVVAANLSGPRRVASGATRDHVMGVRVVTGAGELIHSGGRVLKNVTGLDLCKLLTGSHGTLGVITEVTLKVLPAPEASATLILPKLPPDAAIRALSLALGSPFGVSGAAWVPSLPGSGVPAALIRIEDFAASVSYRIERLRGLLDVAAAEIVADDASRALWRAVRDATLLPVGADDAVWRVSVRPSAGAEVLRAMEDACGARGFLDWGGGLVWLAAPASTQTHAAVEASALRSGGVWTLMRAPAALRGAVDVVPPEVPALARITARVKAAMDPAGILNPGRIFAGV